jgi:uncharacterized C2H2 Zn-finger protein
MLDLKKPYKYIVGQNEIYYIQNGVKYNVLGKEISDNKEEKQEKQVIIKCPHCENIYTDKEKFKQHLKAKHSKVEKKESNKIGE